MLNGKLNTHFNEEQQTVMSNLLSYVELKIEECQRKSETLFNTRVSNLSIEINNRMFRCFGKAFYEAEDMHYNYRIQISGKIFGNISDTKKLDNTIIHEFCHVLAKHKYNTFGHDHYWKSLMRDFGEVPKASTNHEECAASTNFDYKEHRNIVTRYIYKCDCRNFELSSKMHTSIQKGNGRRCSSCKTRLVYTNQFKKV